MRVLCFKQRFDHRHRDLIFPLQQFFSRASMGDALSSFGLKFPHGRTRVGLIGVAL